jgi:hypothetical protein
MSRTEYRSIQSVSEVLDMTSTSCPLSWLVKGRDQVG